MAILSLKTICQCHLASAPVASVAPEGETHLQTFTFYGSCEFFGGDDGIFFSFL